MYFFSQNHTPLERRAVTLLKTSHGTDKETVAQTGASVAQDHPASLELGSSDSFVLSTVSKKTLWLRSCSGSMGLK